MILQWDRYLILENDADEIAVDLQNIYRIQINISCARSHAT